MKTTTGTLRSLSTLAASLLLSLSALAATDAPPLPDPSDAEASVPHQQYRSPITDFRSPKEIAIGDWKAANGAVTKRKRAAEPASPSPENPAHNHGTAPQASTTKATAAMPNCMDHGMEHDHHCEAPSSSTLPAMTMKHDPERCRAMAKMPGCDHESHESHGKEESHEHH